MNYIINYKLFESLSDDDKKILEEMVRKREVNGILLGLRNGYIDVNQKILSEQIIGYLDIFIEENKEATLKLLHYLVENDADADYVNRNDETSLMVLYDNGLIDEMFYLIDNGADLFIKGYEGDIFDLMNYYRDTKTLNEIKTRFPEQYEKYLKKQKANEFNL